MSAHDRDLVDAIRAELAAVDPSRPCDRDAEVAGLGSALATRDPSVVRLAVRLGGATVDGDRHPGGLRTRRLRLGPSGAAELADWPWERMPEHCRIAWVRGLFLAHGSLSVGGGRAHLEFVVAPEEAPLLADRLGELGLPASRRLRRGRGVVTWKDRETIAHFLRLAGGGAALLELEARAVSRAFRGELNRVINAEAANLQRAVAAAARQLEAIDLLEADGRLTELPWFVRAVAAERRAVPEATLADLAERLTCHRSAVQRALVRIERLAFEGTPDR